MSDLDTKSWSEAARSYERLRRRNLRFTVAYVGSFFGFVILFFAASEMNFDALATTLFLLFIPASCAFGLGSLLTSFELWGFRCPRCGKRFIVAWRGSWPTDRCKQCGLDFGSAARAPTTLLSDEDRWE